MTAMVCDLGGTNCRLALWDGQTGQLVRVARYTNADFTSFPALLANYLDASGRPALERVAIALAAPVENDSTRLTNLDWTLETAEILETTGAARVDFLNDLEALAWAVHSRPELQSQELSATGDAPRNATRLVIGIGTGFNSAAVTPEGQVISSETGHVTFPAQTDLDRRIQEWATRRFGRCSIERVLSGSGLEAIHSQIHDEPAPSGAGPGSHDIVAKGVAGSDPAAMASCREFCRILGTVAGDLALAFMAEGGIYLNGGVARAMVPLLAAESGEFITAFRSKGRMQTRMSRFPIFLLTDDTAALLGCVAWLE